MDNKNQDLLNEINRKLGIIVALLANSSSKTDTSISLKDQIKLLSQFGLRPSEISTILNKKPSHVSKELTLLRKTNK